MRAMELSDPGPIDHVDRLRLVDRPDLEPGEGEVRIDVSACAVCRTDLQIVEGDLGAHRLPIVPGHQIVGRVTALGDGVDGDALPLGARVGVAWIADTDGTCRFCTSG